MYLIFVWSEFLLCVQQVRSGCACFWAGHTSATVWEIQYAIIREAPVTIQRGPLETWTKFTSLLHWNELVWRNLTSCLNWWAQSCFTDAVKLYFLCETPFQLREYTYNSSSWGTKAAILSYWERGIWGILRRKTCFLEVARGPPIFCQ